MRNPKNLIFLSILAFLVGCSSEFKGMGASDSNTKLSGGNDWKFIDGDPNAEPPTQGTGPGACTNPEVDRFCRNGGRPPDFSNLVRELALQYDKELARCDRSNSDEFVRIVVQTLRSRGETRWGFNWVRGNIGDSNGDVIGYYYGPGNPTENSPYNSIVDVILNCGAPGAVESVTWGEHPPESYELCCNPNGSTKWTLDPL